MRASPMCIGDVIAHGILFNPRYPAGLTAMDIDQLLASIPSLFELLEKRGVGYVLVGGIAMRVHTPGRNTQDIDLIIPADHLAKIPEVTIIDRNDSFARAEFGGLQVDILLADHALFELVRAHHAGHERFAERDIVCATVEGLLMLKLFALPSLYRQGRFSRVEDYEHDVAVLLRQYHPDMEPLFAELARHVSAADLAEVRSIVADIQRRITESATRFGAGPAAAGG